MVFFVFLMMLIFIILTPSCLREIIGAFLLRVDEQGKITELGLWTGAPRLLIKLLPESHSNCKPSVSLSNQMTSCRQSDLIPLFLHLSPLLPTPLQSPQILSMHAKLIRRPFASRVKLGFQSRTGSSHDSCARSCSFLYRCTIPCPIPEPS